MILIFIYSCLIVIFTAPYALLISKDNETSTYSYSKNIIFGIIFLCFIGILLNFFLPLNVYVCSLIPLISLTIILKYKRKFINLSFLKFIIIQAIILTILLTESNVYRPDAGLYHLPYIGILNSEKIIFGISNIHSRYALTSVLQYFSAINNNLIFKDNGIIFAQALIASSIIIIFIAQLNKYLKKREFNFHFFYLFFIMIFITYKMNSEYGNDAPAHFLVFFLISEILLISKIKLKDFSNNLVLSLFIVQNKLTLIFIVLINLININKIKLNHLIIDRRFIFATFFLIIWLVKNIISSGCLLYPIKLTCIDQLSWTKIETVNKVSISAEAWTKGWSNKKSSLEISQEDFIKNFKWFDSWSKVHLQLIIKILIPYLIFCSLIVLFLKIKYKNKTYYTHPKKFYYFISIFLICSLIWFLKSPLFRYGYSYIICFIAFILSYLSLKINLNYNKKNYLLISIIILCITTLVGKNLIRIHKTENHYNNYPWPKFYSMNKSNVLTDFNNVSFKYIDIVIPLKGYCMYVKKVCSHYGIEQDFIVKKKQNYLFFLKKN